MSKFIEVLTHGRKLQGAVKTLSIEELEGVSRKLESIIKRRKIKEEQALRLQEEKNIKAAAIKKQMEEAGLDITDLQAVSDVPVKSKTGKKRPIKYSIIDDKGEKTNWTGIGRMPRVFKNALDNGKNLSDFSV